jgi:4-alpha-glucanotransferase
VTFKEAYQGRPWWSGREYAFRDPARNAASELHDALEIKRLAQFLFFRQWESLRRRAHGVRVLGDPPIFMARDSATLGASGVVPARRRRSVVVAGVPPDYFSATGQLWAIHSTTGRPAANGLRPVDRTVAEHAAVGGRRPAGPFPRLPGVLGSARRSDDGHRGGGSKAREDLLTTLRTALGGHDRCRGLGFITAEVDALQTFRSPGHAHPSVRLCAPSKIGSCRHLERNVVVYTGTHDNDTTLAGTPP